MRSKGNVSDTEVKSVRLRSENTIKSKGQKGGKGTPKLPKWSPDVSGKTKEKEEENEGTYKNMETCGIPSAGQVAKLRPVG